MSDPIIQINNMNKWFGDFQVLKDINLDVEKNKKIVVCGPSGSGKSTLIRCINRLEEHQKGSIIVDGTELTEDTKNIEQIRAEVGMVFQQFNLFTHLSILDNSTLALDPEMIKEVLDAMVSLAKAGMTMIVVTHEMGFAKEVADEVIFMDEGMIVEKANTKEFFANPKSDRTKLFLSQIL